MGAITAEVVETGEKRDGRGRRVVAHNQRMALVEAYRASGLTMAAFARREAINYTTFAGWMAKAGKGGTHKSAIRFAEIRVGLPPPVAEPSHLLEVRLGDGTVLRGSRVVDLVALVKGLRA